MATGRYNMCVREPPLSARDSCMRDVSSSLGPKHIDHYMLTRGQPKGLCMGQDFGQLSGEGCFFLCIIRFYDMAKNLVYIVFGCWETI